MLATLADTLRADLVAVINDASPNDLQQSAIVGGQHNPDLYVDVDLSGIHFGPKSGTLVSPDIVVSAQHFGGLPNPLTFIAPDGTKHVRRIIGAAKVPGSVDMRLSRLDSPLPPEIEVYKVPDPDFMLGHTRTAPVVMIDQHDDAYIGRIHPDAGFDASYATIIKDKGKFGKLYKDMVGGDSGHPSFFVWNGELVFVSAWHFPQLGPYAGFHQDAMRETAAALGSTFEIESVEWGVTSDYDTGSGKGNGKTGKGQTATSEPISDDVAAYICNAVYPQTCYEMDDDLLELIIG